MLQPVDFMNKISFSRHATKRSQQRGIRQALINALLERFDLDRPVGDGCHALSCSRAELARAREDGVPTAIIERLGRVVLVISPDGIIVTAINRETWFARFQRGHARLSARERARKAERRRRGGGFR